MRRTLDRCIAMLAVVFSIEGLVWLAATLLVAATLCGWLETPLQGVIRGYAFSLFSGPALGDGLTNPVRFLSAALPCLLAAAIALWCTLRRRSRWPELHLAAALLFLVVSVPIVITVRHPLLVEALVNQNEEREAVRSFASTILNPATLPYSAMLPAHELAGTATLVARAQTVLQLLGYGWWFALAGAGLLLVSGLRFVGRRHAVLALGCWSCLTVVVATIAVWPAGVAEYHRLRGEGLYARGEYAEALARFRTSITRAPNLAENRAFQYRLGATLVWLGDRTSPPARLFLAQNLRDQGELATAELELKSALATEPHSKLLRRSLAELNAERGALEFAEPRAAGAPWRWEFEPNKPEARWAQAADLDPSMLRLRYFLAHAYHRIDGVDQRRAIAEASRLIGLIRDRGVLSDAYALLGDCYFKGRDDTTARQMYAKALDIVPLVKLVNLKAQRGLLGL